ncbi:MAG: pyrroline-5-carboxylate reductase [Emergencia sp.]
MLEMNSVKLGFIGYGNMAGAVSRGLIRSGAVRPDQIYACARDYEKLCGKAAEDGIHPCESALDTAGICDVIFIGVKPYMIEEVMSPLKEALEGKIVISLAANTYSDRLQEILPASRSVATLPNTPVSVCEGIFLCETENSLAPEEREFTDALLCNLGAVFWMDRKQMDIGGVLAGCAPAFAAMFIEALGDAGCKHGLSRDTAYRLASQMLAGTGRMAMQSGDHPGRMKDAVCSPGGTTIVGVSALEKNGFRYAVIDAVDQIENKVQGKL